MTVRIISTNNVTTTVSFEVNQLELSNEELFLLLDKALGHKVEHKTYEGYTMDDDYTIHTETYADKADKELLRLMKIRLEKSEDELKPTRNTWQTP